jgi:hypothetical protein
VQLYSSYSAGIWLAANISDDLHAASERGIVRASVCGQTLPAAKFTGMCWRTVLADALEALIAKILLSLLAVRPDMQC